jgi:hypothetical protein
MNQQKDDGVVRGYYDQSYTSALQNGDLALTMAWSGDLFQMNLEGDASGLQFCVPDEGVIIWTDNMCIPIGVENPVDAITYMDYVYQPDVQATIESYVNYICPVPSAKDVIAPEFADSPLIFPSDEDLAKTHTYYAFKTPEELNEWNARSSHLPVVEPMPRAEGGGALSTPSVDEIVRSGTPLIEPRKPSRNKKLAPYELLAPGALYLAIFFLIPIVYMFYTSLQSGFIGDFHFNWHFANYADAIKLHGDIYVRSLVYAGIVTALALVLAYPVAYWIAFYGGRRKSVFLFLLLLRSFVSFIIRTVQWQFCCRTTGDPGAAEADEASCRRTSPDCSALGDRRDRGHHVQLPAVHRPAAVRRARAHRQATGGGR